jgi:hypothetical protein
VTAKVLYVRIDEVQIHDVVRLNGHAVAHVEQPYEGSKVRLHYVSEATSPWYEPGTQISILRYVPTKRFEVTAGNETWMWTATDIVTALNEQAHPSDVTRITEIGA